MIYNSDCPDTVGRKLRRRRQAIREQYSFHANSKGFVCSTAKKQKPVQLTFLMDL